MLSGGDTAWIQTESIINISLRCYLFHKVTHCIGCRDTNHGRGWSQAYQHTQTSLDGLRGGRNRGKEGRKKGNGRGGREARGKGRENILRALNPFQPFNTGYATDGRVRHRQTGCKLYASNIVHSVHSVKQVEDTYDSLGSLEFSCRCMCKCCSSSGTTNVTYEPRLKPTS